MSDEPTFKAGDQVQHLSGGPKMTVVSESIVPDEFICRWMAPATTGNFIHEESSFHKDEIKIFLIKVVSTELRI